MSVAGGELTMRLYPKAVATTTLEVELTLTHSGLRFTTQLHGGFGECSFHLAANYGQAWLWYDAFARWKRLQIYEAGWGVVWEGRVEDTELVLGGVNVTALGYWSSLFDYPHMVGTAPPAPQTWNANQTAEDIIKAVLTASGDLIASDQSNIDDPALIIATAGDPYAPEDMTPAKIIIDLARMGDAATDALWWFAVWADRVPHFHAQDASVLDWQVRLEDFVPGGLSLRKTPSEFASRVYATYLVGGTKTWTNEASDTDIEADQRRRTYVVPALGEVDAGVATQRRDTELAARKYIHPQSRFTIQAVRDSNGLSRPLWRVRAGDVLRIVDLVPASSGLTTVALDRLRTFFIRRTAFDADSGTLTVEPELGAPNLARQMVSLGAR